ncbi:hypothetical protein LCGC14_0295750 [marine sediment metagenome]|uniref:Transglutaminase-like domain-containing protein n=1 Tax=marine sediment metagenome TaxID=412755 RepID=A0A0F9TRR9_9ZZZZ|nr:DUF3488 domain-containing protein [Phycisphaerae bacterium]HDZ43015.1 DUF3488 domain-containing protein [Phycisphaerae bacterium]
MPLRSFSEAEIVLKARRRLEGPLLVMVWLSIAMASMAEGNYPFLVVGTITVAVNLLATLRGKEIYLHPLVVNVLVLTGSALVLVELISPQWTMLFTNTAIALTAITHFIMILLICKLLQRKHNRDYVQMLTLSTLTVLSGSLVCEFLWYAAACVVFVVLAGYVGMALTLKRGLDTTAEARLPTETHPPPPGQVAWHAIRDWPGRSLRRRLASIVVCMAAGAVLLFASAPRLSRLVDPIMVQSLGAITGLAETVHLGDAKRITVSDRVVMTVRLRDSSGDPVPGAAIQYFCATTASRYENSTWQAPKDPPNRRLQAHLPNPTDELREGAIVQEVSMRALLLPHLPAGSPVVHVRPHVGRWRLTSSEVARLVGNRAGKGHVGYTAWSWPQPLDPRQRAYLQRRRQVLGIAVDPPNVAAHLPKRVVALARQWCADLLAGRADNPRQRDQWDLRIARRLSQRLSEQYRYTLDLTAADPSRDGVDDFLFHMKQGHCEYFASALTVMCQALGVRARLATGFRTSEVDPASGEIIVRQRDAHAWCQVYTPSTDFVIVDPSPAPADLAPVGGTWRNVRRWWERLQFLWYENIVGYDMQRQQRLGGYLRRQLGDLGAWAYATATRMGDSVTTLIVEGKVDAFLKRLTQVVFSATGVVALLVLGRFVLRRRRLQRAYRAGHAVPPTQMAFMRRLLNLFRRKGLAAKTHQTPREVLAAAAQRFDLPERHLSRLADLYDRLRWGNAPASPRRLAAADRQVDHIAQLLSR